MNNPGHQSSFIQNPFIVLVVMAFYTILGWVVFNLFPTPCRSDHIWSFTWIIRVKIWFVRVGIEILNKHIETLKISKSRSHCLGSKVTLFITNFNPGHYRNVIYLSKSMSKFTRLFRFWFLKGLSFQCNCSHDLLLLRWFHLKSVWNLLNFPVGKHSLTDSIMWSVSSIINQ